MCKEKELYKKDRRLQDAIRNSALAHKQIELLKSKQELK